MNIDFSEEMSNMHAIVLERAENRDRTKDGAEGWQLTTPRNLSNFYLAGNILGSAKITQFGRLVLIFFFTPRKMMVKCDYPI